MQGRPARSHIARVAHRVRTILGAPRGSGTSFSRLDLPSSRTTGAWAGPNRCACCRRRGPEPIAGSRAPAVACLWHARCLHAVWSGELQVPHRHKRHRHKRPMPRLGGALTLLWSRLPWIGLDLPTGAWEAREHDRPPTSPGAAAAGLESRTWVRTWAQHATRVGPLVSPAPHLSCRHYEGPRHVCRAGRADLMLRQVGRVEAEGSRASGSVATEHL